MFVCQERAGVKMIMIQDGPMPTGADKPLRISGDPYKVQVHINTSDLHTAFNHKMTPQRQKHNTHN